MDVKARYKEEASRASQQATALIYAGNGPAEGRSQTLPNGLTVKQEHFSQLLASGRNQSDAYAIAFNPPNASRKTINEQASKTAKFPKVQERVKEIRAEWGRMEMRDLAHNREAVKLGIAKLASGRDSDGTKIAHAVQLAALVKLGEMPGIDLWNGAVDPTKAGRSLDDLFDSLANKIIDLQAIETKGS